MARPGDVHALAMAMPAVSVELHAPGRPVYQVGGKSFVFYRSPRPDAVDPVTGERYDDVIVLWVASAEDKEALLLGRGAPLFTTAHFYSHNSVLLRASHVHELAYDELRELVQDAWLARAPVSRARAWLAQQGPGPEP
jgi:hypothetical protein